MGTVAAGGKVRADYSYDALSRRSGLDYPYSRDVSYSYYSDNRLASLTHSGIAANGNDLTWQFGFTDANKLTRRIVSDDSFAWTPAGTNTDTYAINGLNQVTSINAVLTNYDGDGNMTARRDVAGDDWIYTYDAENRLTQTSKTGTVVDYAYDPLGRLYLKTVNGTVNWNYAYDGVEPIQDYQLDGGIYRVARAYVNGAGVDERLMVRGFDTADGTGAFKRFYHTDHQGTVIALSNTTGLQATYTYDEYGVPGQDGGEPFRYTGRRWDGDSRLYYYRARWYSPEGGRFLQTDPIGYKDDMNLYGYVANDPMNNTDPSGLCGSLIKGHRAFNCVTIMWGSGTSKQGEAGRNKRNKRVSEQRAATLKESRKKTDDENAENGQMAIDTTKALIKTFLPKGLSVLVDSADTTKEISLMAQESDPVVARSMAAKFAGQLMVGVGISRMGNNHPLANIAGGAVAAGLDRPIEDAAIAVQEKVGSAAVEAVWSFRKLVLSLTPNMEK